MERAAADNQLQQESKKLLLKAFFGMIMYNIRN